MNLSIRFVRFFSSCVPYILISHSNEIYVWLQCHAWTFPITIICYHYYNNDAMDDEECKYRILFISFPYFIERNSESFTRFHDSSNRVRSANEIRASSIDWVFGISAALKSKHRICGLAFVVIYPAIRFTLVSHHIPDEII